MKELIGKIGSLPDKAVIALSIVLTLLLSALLLALVAWPSFSSLGQVATEIEAEDTKLAGINASTAFLSKEDKKRLESLKAFLEQLVPEKVDLLHFATLNELVSQAAGVTVNNIQITKGSSAATKAPVTTAPGIKTSGAATPSTPVQTSQVAATNVSVTYTSGFDSLLALIQYWVLADQLVGIKDLNISGVAAGSLNYTVNYELPTSPAVQKATVEDKFSLTEEQKKNLEELKAKIIYTATPSANSVGRSNPFN